MYRNIINELAVWYEEPRKRILYVKGALGVGKTWTVTDFATGFFDGYKIIDLSSDEAFISILYNTSDVESSVEALDTLLSEQFGEIDYTKNMLIFDEVQNIPDIDRFFYEYGKKHRDYVICLIASSMRITEFEYHHKDVFNIIRMRPMTFDEFLIANKANSLIAAIENATNNPLNPVEETMAKNMLRDYMIVGGMPGVVYNYIKNKNLEVVRNMQLELINNYQKLIKASFSAAMSQRCRRILRSIPFQLAHDNKKFMYRFVEDNARSREYSEATQNLCDLGLSRKLPRLSRCIPPLESHVDHKSFELFMLDHGLLRAQFNLPADETLTLEEIFTEENGAVAEQYIFQELSSKVGFLYYWISKATARVPFVYEGEEAAIPVDVRFTANKKAQNIKTFKAQNKNTDISVKISLDPVSFESGVLTIPAYGLWNM